MCFFYFLTLQHRFQFWNNTWNYFWKVVFLMLSRAKNLFCYSDFFYETFIHTFIHCPNWDITNASITDFFFLQAHLWSDCWWCIEFLNCFFQRLFLWSSKRSFDPKIIPSSFILFSLVMVLLLILPRKMSFLVLRYMTFSTIYFHVYKMNNYWGF